MAEPTRPQTAPKDDSGASALRRSLGLSLTIFVSIGAVSSWLFYDLYWKWHAEVAGGEFTDPAGRTLYIEFAVWGIVAVLAFAMALGALYALRRAAASGPAASDGNGTA